MLLGVSACSPHVSACPKPVAGDVVYIVGRGWHAEIGIPAEQLNGRLAFYREVFPDARVVMLGYGKKTFFTAPPDSVSEYFLGPFPGPAVIQAVGLRVTPLQAYPQKDVVELALPAGGMHALSEFIAQDLTPDDSGKPLIVAHSHNPEGLFYAARSQYTLLHTCNAWAADALHSTGLPIDSDGVIFSGQVTARLSGKGLCQPLLGGN